MGHTKKLTDDQIKALEKVAASLRQVDQEFKAFGSSYDYVGERAKALEKGVSTLIEAGFNAQSKAVRNLINELTTLGAKQKELAGSFGKIGFDGLDFKSQNLFKQFQLPNLQIDVSGAEETSNLFARVGDSIAATVEKTQGVVNAFTQNLVDSYKSVVDFGRAASNSLAEFAGFAGETLGNLFTGDFNAKDFFKGLMQIVSSFLGQFGKALIAAGVGALAFKKLLVNPPAAIAAGIALTALAGVVASIASKGPSGSGSGSSAPAPQISQGLSALNTSAVSKSIQASVAAAPVTTTGSVLNTLNITGELVLVDRGGKLVGLFNKQNQKLEKTTGGG